MQAYLPLLDIERAAQALVSSRLIVRGPVLRSCELASS
jgi:hypothetical protein